MVANGGHYQKKYGNWHTIYMRFRQRSHKNQIKNKSKGDGRNKNRIKLIITSKNFSKAFQSQGYRSIILRCL